MTLCTDCTLVKEHLEKVNRYGMISEIQVPCNDYKKAKERLTTIGGKVVGCSDGVPNV